MSKKSLYLDLDFDYDFELISIVSSYRDYRICWHLNQQLGLDLAFKEELKLEKAQKRKASAYFNLYAYTDELNKTQYYLVSNKSAGEFLVPELKEVDFFLQFSGGNSPLEKDKIVQTLKGLSVIEAVFATDPASLKSKQNLVFE